MLTKLHNASKTYKILIGLTGVKHLAVVGQQVEAVLAIFLTHHLKLTRARRGGLGGLNGIPIHVIDRAQGGTGGGK